MTHRQVYSQGSIPFSWEDKPGISKVANQECPLDYRTQAPDITSQNLPSKQQTSLLSKGSKLVPTSNEVLKIPPPPCPSQPPSRSSSAKGLRWQEDPFLLAYKACTKSVKKGKDQDQDQDHHNKNGRFKVKKSVLMYFSCKNSCKARNDNFVKLTQLPALPRQKPEDLMMENW